MSSIVQVWRAFSSKQIQALSCAVALVCLCGCWKRPYASDIICDVELSGDKIFLVVDHQTGYKVPVNGMSHRTGVAITQQTFFEAKYDITATNYLKLKSIEPLLSVPSNEHYEFSLMSNGAYLCKVYRDEKWYLRQVSPANQTSNAGQICISRGEPFINGPIFFFNRSHSMAVLDRSGFELFDLEKMESEGSFFFKEPDTSEFAKWGGGHLTDDGRFLLFTRWPNSHEIASYGRDGNVTVKFAKGSDHMLLRDVEMVDGKLLWIGQNDMTAIGDVEQGILFEIKKTGLSSVKWDYQKNRVLIIPVGFILPNESAFKQGFTLWSYTVKKSIPLAISYPEFSRELERAVRNNSKR